MLHSQISITLYISFRPRKTNRICKIQNNSSNATKTLLDELNDHKQKYSKWVFYIFGSEYSLHLIMFSQFESQFESKFTSKSIESNHFVSLIRSLLNNSNILVLGFA